MSMFTLAVSCLITSNLPWFMDLCIPGSYAILLFIASDFTSITSQLTKGCFCFDSIPSFFLGLVVHWSPVAYWAPNNWRSSSFSVLSFCLFILFMGFSRQECWRGLPFLSPVDLEKAEEPEIKLPTSLDHRKNKRVPEKHLLLLFWLCQILWLCGSQQTAENS